MLIAQEINNPNAILHVVTRLRFNELPTAVNNLPKRTYSVVLTMVKSKDWITIGKKLASLENLVSLNVSHCNSDDDLCKGISNSKSITRLSISNLSYYR